MVRSTRQGNALKTVIAIPYVLSGCRWARWTSGAAASAIAYA
jgi:hypothetical protein